MFQRRLFHQSRIVDSHKTWKPGAHGTACGQLSRLVSALFWWLSCSEPLPGSSAESYFIGSATLSDLVTYQRSKQA